MTERKGRSDNYLVLCNPELYLTFSFFSSILSHRDDNHTELISSSRASYIIPAHFQEKFIRVYIRRESDEQTGNQVKHAAQVAFRKLLRRLNLHSQLDTAVTAPRTGFGPNDLYDPDTEGSGENTSNETETERTRQGQNRSDGSHTNERLAKRQKPNVGNEVDR